jgi:two-component system chemotaxis response regulator CheY
VKALVIDDSKAMRSILKKILGEIGFEVIQAGNGRQALEGLQRVGEFDIALVDWNMPEMNGYEFVCAVRDDEAFDGMLLMMVTTETEMSQVIKALEAGANEYVMKPFTKEVVVEKLELLGLLDGQACFESAS